MSSQKKVPHRNEWKLYFCECKRCMLLFSVSLMTVGRRPGHVRKGRLHKGKCICWWTTLASSSKLAFSLRHVCFFRTSCTYASGGMQLFLMVKLLIYFPDCEATLLHVWLRVTPTQGSIIDDDGDKMVSHLLPSREFKGVSPVLGR